MTQVLPPKRLLTRRLEGRKLSSAKIRAHLQGLYSFWNNIKSATVRSDEADARLWIVDVVNKLPDVQEDASQARFEEDSGLPPPQDAETKALAREVGEWLEAYIK